MNYGYKKSEPEENFKIWLCHQSKLIDLAIEKGYTRDQAIKLLKVWNLELITDIISTIG